MDLSPDEDNFQGRLLHQAALWDNVELLQELLSAGADVNARDALCRTALHAAALAERSECLLALCAAGADLDAVSAAASGGKTALHISAERGHVENVKTLLSAGASLTIPDAGGDCALALAERGGHRHAACALREARDALERERLSQHAQLRELVSRWDIQGVKLKLASLGPEAGLIVNLTPGGASTLLYVASELGYTPVVAALLDAGADGRAHPVTKYCPLYIASYRGHHETAQLLLVHYPQAAQQETVEKWLPLHAACIGGHPNVVKLLLEFPYPESMLSTYTDPAGSSQYRLPFDVNARDVSGQTALYVACTLGNVAVVSVLLSHTVPCWKITQNEEEPDPPPQQVLSPTRGISLGIHAIVSRLTRQSSVKNEDAPSVVSPVAVWAGRGREGCLAAAARAGSLRVCALLLAAGAQPDAPAGPPEHPLTTAEQERESRRKVRSSSALPGRSSTSPSPCRNNYSSSDCEGGWTALALAAHAKNIPLIELLLSHGATDPHCRALRECARHRLENAVAKILATKAYPDPDHKVNKAPVAESVFERAGNSALTFSALCPATAVTLNWRELRCQLAKIRMQWVREAALRVNPKLGSDSAALHAITRIDISNNELRVLPPELFTLLSLRYLNAAQNKLERLPSLNEPFDEEPDSMKRRGKKTLRVRTEVYSAPVLQDLYLQDNRLEELPPELFSLPSLTTLDVSNNKLRQLPYQMWTAPKLKDLNAALNHLKDLPYEDDVPSDASSPSEQTQGNVSPSVGFMSQFVFNSQMKSTSRSPSIERSISDVTVEDDEEASVLESRAGHATENVIRRVHAWRGAVEAGHAAGPAAESAAGSALLSLNLSHNQFTRVPPALACRAPHLQRLHMAYNSLRTMSYVTSYPNSLRQLDLSHNEITCWPSLPQFQSFSDPTDDPLRCYCAVKTAPTGRARARSGGPRAQLLGAACAPRRHLALHSLRTLILSNNLLTRIQLTTDDDGYATEAHEDSTTDDEDDERGLKGRLLFPLLSMLDVACNLLRAVPPSIHALSNLAVLNISGNKEITELPPEMGLLSRLWNLSTAGCALREPLAGLVRRRGARSVDVVGYLKSVLQEARPYASLKLMLVGKQGIGKTSLLECLRQESTITHRRKPTEHWAKRMGNKSSRRNMSTVGVDIGSWVYEKPRSARGPVTFRTWDFGGQKEYYATHQYFLSRRSLYLVVWKVTEGRKGLAGALQWLRSIQARAPGSPVIMVATHYDQVPNCHLPENESPEALQRLIRSSIMGAPDADKIGLPKVLDSVEVSCSTKHNIRLLADIVYTTAFSIKPPGSKEPLLEQRVPATYLALEECVTHLANELKEPVLRHEEYKRLVTQYMQQKNHRMFRDAAELHQATMFLHENGVLLHYDDATLKELYFLKPQWLCDVLAHVVTVREINPFANNGIMRIDDLPLVFKASPQLARGDEAGALGLSLLHKFELALSWDARRLLVPPLLPAREPITAQLPVRSSLRRRGWPTPSLPPRAPPRATDSPTLIHESPVGNISIAARSSGRGLVSLLLLSYIPLGFWARLIARLLADEALASCAPSAYALPQEIDIDDMTAKALELNWSWKLWKTGLKLVCGELTLASVRELPSQCDELLGARLVDDDDEEEEHPYQGVKFRIHQEGMWSDLDVHSSACIEILLPGQVCVAKRDDGLPIAGYQSISLESSLEIQAKILSLLSDHVDLLLEDWYPSLGTRFVHTSEGRCLITRLLPCRACLREPEDHPALQAFKRLELNGGDPPRRVRVSEESRTSDGDSGVGAESNASSLGGSSERWCGVSTGATTHVVRAWTQERCVLLACTGASPVCELHGPQPLSELAPHTLFLDASPLARWEEVTVSGVLGRGAFGTVLAGSWRGRPVAVKALQPAEPRCPRRPHDLQAYKAAVSRWEREPAAAACRAYCAVRQEYSVLSALSHGNVVPLRAVCAAPLALLLPLAPRGALDGVLREYRACGCRVGVRAVRALGSQAARALEYLHARKIVYRDLKSENVLVWAMPKPAEAVAAERASSPIDVHIKLGDYGISRLAPLSGTKGFGGTEGFMAPEIMRYNGEEEYTEKVDCFSFGMLLYEIITLRQPFEGHEAVKEAVLDGARPTLTARELRYPCNLLCMMRQCWSAAPSARPSAAALLALCAAPELSALQDACAVPAALEAASCGLEVWFGGCERAYTIMTDGTHFTNQFTIKIPPDKSEPVTVTSMCCVGTNMWLGDSTGRVSVYSASSCALQWTVSLSEAVGGAPSPVSALCPLVELQRVALSLRCGRLFLVTSDQPQEEGSFVLTELGTATELCCLAAVLTSSGFEVWAGGSSLDAYSVSAEGVSGFAPLLAETRVALLAAQWDQPCVFVYTQPGCCVTQWSVKTRQETARLDCSKLVPCSESLQSIELDERLTDDHSQVTALCAFQCHVYVGTAWGCVLVATWGLRPVTVVRVHERVKAIIPLQGGDEEEGRLVTLGVGYRPLLQRFVPQAQTTTTTVPSGNYCLLWRTDHWLPD